MLLQPWTSALLAYDRVILASASPRRKELLRTMLEPLNVPFEAEASTFAEDLPKDQHPGTYARATAQCKGAEVCEAHKGENVLVISADTVVALADGTILEKPQSDEDARRMLGLLSASAHKVYTGVAIFAGPSRRRAFTAETTVTFSELSPEAIASYVATGEPSDKAGSYAIQGFASAFVASIAGCYFNVVGLPINRLSLELIDLFAESEPKVRGEESETRVTTTKKS